MQAHARAGLASAVWIGIGFAGFVGVVVGAHLLGSWLTGLLRIELTPRTEPFIHQIIIWSAAAYGVLIAIPFVPGIELAIALIMVAGAGIVAFLYLITLVSLTVSFTVGYCVPLATLGRFFAMLGKKRTLALIAKLDSLDPNEKLQFLVSRAPRRIVPWLLRHRYIAVAFLLNMPGNMIVGGGGGLCLLAGLCKLFSPAKFVVTIALAVAPLPLAVLLLGQEVLV